MYKAMFTIMYYGCLRASEVLMTDTPQHNLALSNIKMMPNEQAFVITFTSFKHSISSTTLEIATTDGPDCPVQALKEFLRLRQNNPGPLFIKANQPVTRKAFISVLKACLKYLNVSPDNYNIHSFRIGRTTDMAEQNISHAHIQRIGRWRSNAYLKYIRPQNIAAQPIPHHR
jgi:hypothetical protein